MQVVLIGARHMRGTAKKTGNAYDFSVLLFLSAIKAKQSEKFELKGCGFEAGEIRTTPEVVDAVSRLGAPFPCRVVLTIGNEIGQFGQLEALCTGVALDRAVPASAPARAA
jgi:hypothetical protein